MCTIETNSNDLNKSMLSIRKHWRFAVCRESLKTDKFVGRDLLRYIRGASTVHRVPCARQLDLSTLRKTRNKRLAQSA